jgi:heptosyltransferase-2
LQKINEDGRDHRPIFVINPGAKFQAKCWPAEHFGTVISQLTRHYNATIVVTGICDERNIADKVVEKSGQVAINLAGQTTLQELVELLRMAKGCITNDTGTMHIAAMVGVPTVAIFSFRLSPTHWFPLSQKMVALFSFEDCGLCYKDFCNEMKCLRNISENGVLQALNGLLDLPTINRNAS